MARRDDPDWDEHMQRRAEERAEREGDEHDESRSLDRYERGLGL